MRFDIAGWLGLLLLCCAGCGDSHESIYAEVVGSHREINNILENVDDQSDPAETADAIQLQVEQLMDLKSRADKLEPPAPETELSLRQQYAKEIQVEKERSTKLVRQLKDKHPVVWQKVNSSLTKLQNP